MSLERARTHTGAQALRKTIVKRLPPPESLTGITKPEPDMFKLFILANSFRSSPHALEREDGGGGGTTPENTLSISNRYNARREEKEFSESRSVFSLKSSFD